MDVAVVEVELLSDEGKTLFLSLAECEGIPNMYKTDASTFEKHFEDPIDEAFFEFYQEFRYLTYIARSAREDVEKFMAETKGKCFGDFEIPKSDLEEDWEYEKECEEGEE